MVQPNGIRHQARALVDHLPDDATWDDLMYEIDVRQAIESGLADSACDRVVDLQEVRTQIGIEK